MSKEVTDFLRYVGSRSYIRGVDLLKNFCLSHFGMDDFPNIVSFKILRPISKHGVWTTYEGPCPEKAAAKVKFCLGEGQTQESCFIENDRIITERCSDGKSFIGDVVQISKNSGSVTTSRPLEPFDALDFFIDGNKRLQEMSFDGAGSEQKVFIQFVYLSRLVMPPILSGEVRFVQNMEKSEGNAKYLLTSVTFNDEDHQESSFNLCFSHYYGSNEQ